MINNVFMLEPNNKIDKLNFVCHTYIGCEIHKFNPNINSNEEIKYLPRICV